MLVAVGFGCYVSAGRVLAVVGIGSMPVQRLVREAKRRGTLIDVTHGRRTKAAIFFDSGQIVLSAISPKTIAVRDGPGEHEA